MYGLDLTKRIAASAALILALAPLASRAADPIAPPPKVALAFNRLYDYPDLVAALQTLAAAHPDLMTLRSIGKSVEDRDLWCVTLNNSKTGDDRSKPALYVDGNIHGNEVQAADVCLYFIWYLTENYGKNPALTELLDTRVIYIVPTVNPDGRAHWFNNPNTTNSSRSGKRPFDDDRDGLVDEDGYDDIDGDGQVTLMRRRDPDGRFRVSAEDPRLLVPIRPGDDRVPTERYEILGSEGIDNDGDGQVNEDTPGGYDMNRNFPADWQPENIQGGAGPFPLCWPETKAVADFLLDHPNVAGVVAFHNAAGMILRGAGAETRTGEYAPGDESIMEALGATGTKLLPFYRNLIVYKDLYSVHGGFTNWTYEHLGVYSFVVELWNNEQLLGRSEADGSTLERAVGATQQGAQLFAADRLLFGSNYIPWKPFQHPLYGDIEIGGFVKQSQRVPPPFLIEEMCHRNTAFLVYHADQLPRLEWGDVAAKRSEGSDLIEITATVRNTRLIPTISQQAARREIGLPDSFQVEGEGLTVLGGGIVTDKDLREINPVTDRPERIPLNQGVRGRSSATVSWFVRGGTGPITVRFASPRGGTLTRTVERP